VENGRIFDAWDDEPWIVDGAAVRVSLVCFDAGEDPQPIRLDGAEVSQIFADLSASAGGLDLSTAKPLVENKGISFQGPVKVGAFDIEGDVAREWLKRPQNPNGRPNSDVLRPWANASDMTRRPSGKWIIDFGEMEEDEASLFEAPFEYVRQKIKPIREKNRDEQRRNNWWRLGRSGSDLKAAVMKYDKFIVTPRVSKHRMFCWAHSTLLPDSRVVAIARGDGVTFGILHSRHHELWSLRL